MSDMTFNYEGRKYEVDSQGFLLDFDCWDENFAKGMASQVKILRGLTKEHWDVIHSIRNAFKKMGRCPLIYETCGRNVLRLKDLERLFPAGYLRGACKLAGISSRVGHLGLDFHPAGLPGAISFMESYNKTYEVDVRGFLVNPDQWDEYYAAHRAYEMKLGKLTDAHWKIIRFLRNSCEKSGKIPSVYDTCKENQIDINQLERLFPDGYHRGAIKISGLRLS